MQQTKQATFKQYVLAGNSLAKRERILVSPHVNVENPGEEDARDVFVADVSKRGPYRVSFRMAAIAVVLCLIFSLVMIAGKAALTQRLEEEYALLGARYQAARLEHQRLQEIFDQKSDSSEICYYAVQALGMHLAGYEEIIGVQAVGMPKRILTDAFMGSASNSH